MTAETLQQVWHNILFFVHLMPQNMKHSSYIVHFLFVVAAGQRVSSQDFPLKLSRFSLGKNPANEGKIRLLRPSDITKGSGPSASYGYYGS